MSKLSRIRQKIFGSTASTSEMGKIGSDNAGSPTTTKDLTLIQSLAQYDSGLFSLTSSAGQPPRIQDINALYYLITSQIAYLMQNGISEWDPDTEYFAGISFTTVNGVMYQSLTGTNVSPNDPALNSFTNVPDEPDTKESLR